jgi:hypothetical protein
MPIVNLTRVDNGDGTYTTTASAERSVLEATIDVLTMPLGMTADDSEFVQKNLAGKASAAHFVLGAAVGEAFGNRRGREGKQSFIPLFR